MTLLESSYRTISLTKGQVAIVSPEDYDWLMQFKWCVIWYPTMGKFYAVRAARNEAGKKFILSMQRAILGLTHGDPLRADHINMDTLDNRRYNLRRCTHAENLRNRASQRNNTSGFKGVTPQNGGFMAQIKVNGKRIYLGWKKSAKEASQLYAKAAQQHHGKFARTI